MDDIPVISIYASHPLYNKPDFLQMAAVIRPDSFLPDKKQEYNRLMGNNAAILQNTQVY